MLVAISHLPWYFWDFVFGMGVAVALLATHQHWAKWLKILVFVSALIAWPIALAIWIGVVMLNDSKGT